MTEEVKPEKIKKTQESLLKFIKKPPLTDKLLKKPPFRFLHDIVTSVMKETGFLEGVFSPEELNSENIKDRDGKINFLDKLISHIKSVTGTSISAKPSKIIAGLEVNKTLDLLIALANGVDIKVNGSKANIKTSSSKNETKEAKKTSKSNEPKADINKKKRDDSKGRKKDSRKTPDNKSRGDGNKKNEVNKTNSRGESNNTQNKTSEKNKILKELPKEPVSEATKDVPEAENSVLAKEVENGEPLNKIPAHNDRPPTASKNRKSSADKVSLGANQGSEITYNDIKVERQLSSGEDRTILDNGKSQPNSELRLPDKISLKQVTQISSDSISNSNLSSDPSDSIANGKMSPEMNGEVNYSENSEKPDLKPKPSNVTNRVEGIISKNELEKVDENEKPVEPEKAVKLKRPQSAKMRPGSIRQRRPVDDKSQVSDERVGQVILGQGQTTDVMGSAPITAPSAKGRRILSGRPMSARPGAPKPKDKGQINVSETQSSEEVKPIAVIEDKQADEEEDTENLVIVEKSVKQDETNGIDPTIDSNLDESNQGALVAQILETKKELEDTKRGRWDSPYHQRHNVEIDWEAKSRTRRDMLAREVNNLREGIQTVTRSSNPLGKLFDFLQEDVELMQTELQEWNNTNLQYQKEINLQNKQTEELLSPLNKQLSDLDVLIDHEQESIRRIKSNIYLNSTKLDNLLKINNS